ncbi:hypothetical protein ACLKA6_014647 [Drosophila palustris]
MDAIQLASELQAGEMKSLLFPETAIPSSIEADGEFAQSRRNLHPELKYKIEERKKKNNNKLEKKREWK